MHLSEVQAYAAAQIAANATLAALCTPISYSLFTDDEAGRVAIEAAIRATGVCIEIGSVEAQGDGQAPRNRFSLLEAKFEVLIAESPTIAHTPQDMALVSLVATAMQVRVSQSAPAVRCDGYASVKGENGHILHGLSFSVPVLL